MRTAPFRPLYWPRWLRRLFLVVLPVALPCWLAVMIMALVVITLADLWRPVRRLWSAPQRRRFEYGHYEYQWARSAVDESRPIGRPRIIEPTVAAAE